MALSRTEIRRQAQDRIPPYHLAESAEGEQRWRGGRQAFIPPARRFDPARAEVAAISEKEAKAFVVEHHYAHSYPAARCRVGLFLKAPLGPSKLVGVAVFAVPIQPASVRKYLGCEPSQGVELSRLVLLPEAEFNAETFFLARAFKVVRQAILDVRGVLSYCDPVPRLNAQGDVVKRGHVGTIYRAHNATWHGHSAARTLILTAEGTVLSERTISKLRLAERGAGYAYNQFRALGAPARRPFEADDVYVKRALAEGPFQRVRHPGNLVFSWSWLSGNRGRAGENPE